MIRPLCHDKQLHSLSRSAKTEDRLEKVGKDFESVLAQQMLKEAWPQSENGDGGSEMATSLGIEAVAQSIGQSGALGLSNLILNQLKHQPQKPAATASEDVTATVARTE